MVAAGTSTLPVLSSPFRSHITKGESVKLVIESEVKVVSVNMEADAIVLSYEGEVGKYGHVFFTHRLVPSNQEESKGHFNGFARTILTDGGSVRGTLAGVWNRTGAAFKIHSLDDAIGIPDQNYVDIQVDILTKTGSLKLYSLNED